MDKSTTLDEFLIRNSIDTDDWKKSGLSWEQLQAIAEDHDRQSDYLRDSAELFARVIQRFIGVHSVRWRIKDTEHLMEKIVRKRAAGEEKYASIDPSNYFKVVTDLVGLRALHLFKEDCFSIDRHLRNTWATAEDPIAYVRKGDPADLGQRFSELGFEVKEHPAGYRSVHYVCVTQPMQRMVYAEIQVRTIFEEAWSEIDHRVRYPNFSDNQLVSYFLAIFNRLAGSADEMGTFVRELTGALQESEAAITCANREKEEALEKIKNMVSDLDEFKKQDASSKEKVRSLYAEIDKLRQLNTVGMPTVSTNTRGAAIADLVKGLEPTSVKIAREEMRRIGESQLGDMRIGVEESALIRALKKHM
ncbi:RelA/SpoT domain-containing protein [Giesbergeria anulus]|uniref:PpGpp synthetase catalytic domain-containing protein (RelA/SpoT-type nucleotidyltranferase) n=1 Tax=Giesbergeria anulus TaxID=180197 RepID=A0A1H9E9G3_9BURK|nr:RelA/SpoT domain-containing protein [Giesbergeria anulus]SEQ22212.1 ppGpp synthetase catalytic domain-containing protein (RelA/SpoT-type nucleotidyltranferase) [Giesbergeria anulus]